MKYYTFQTLYIAMIISLLSIATFFKLIVAAHDSPFSDFLSMNKIHILSLSLDSQS